VSYNEELEKRCLEQEEEIERMHDLLESASLIVNGIAYACGECVVGKNFSKDPQKVVEFVTRYTTEQSITLSTGTVSQFHDRILEDLENAGDRFVCDFIVKEES
jgi:hypothetical protein